MTLQPGIYVVTKQIKLSKSPAPGKASLYAHGVMIYFACQNYPTPCAPGEKGGTLSGSGGVVMDWTPPTSGTYKGMSVFYDRENANEFTLTGSSGTVFDGTIYMKSGTLSMTGPSGVTTSMDSMVVVDKLPYDVPSDPLIAARIERIRDEGGNPFVEYQTPLAVLELKQGLGRLLRSRSDRGVLAVMDPRLVTRRYGKTFLGSLPPYRVVRDRDACREFLA